MMILAHDSARYGYLELNGSPIPPAVIARRCGCESLEQYETLLYELDSVAVPSRTPEGVIYSRRMVRDAKQRQIARIEWRQEKRKQRKSLPVKRNVRIVSTKSPPVSSSSFSSSPSKQESPNGDYGWPDEHRDILHFLLQQKFLDCPMMEFGLLDYSWWELTSECIGGKLSISLLQRELPKLRAWMDESNKSLTKRGAKKRVRNWLQNAVEWGERAPRR